jgi:hypothetical protein
MMETTVSRTFRASVVDCSIFRPRFSIFAMIQPSTRFAAILMPSIMSSVAGF